MSKSDEHCHACSAIVGALAITHRTPQKRGMLPYTKFYCRMGIFGSTNKGGAVAIVQKVKVYLLPWYYALSPSVGFKVEWVKLWSAQPSHPAKRGIMDDPMTGGHLRKSLKISVSGSLWEWSYIKREIQQQRPRPVQCTRQFTSFNIARSILSTKNGTFSVKNERLIGEDSKRAHTFIHTCWLLTVILVFVS